jgi:NAD-dependent deacetylase
MISSVLQNKIQHAAQMISTAQHVVIFTGAGISTSSGIPDFRSEGKGLWSRYDSMQVASHDTFFRSPVLFFEWFRPLFLSCWQAAPNPAHLALAQLEKFGKVKSIITQNIDGLHQKAGSREVLELHGSVVMFTCPVCQTPHPAEAVFADFSVGNLIPLCSNCRNILKPDVVLFEEMLPQNVWEDAECLINNADLLLVVGSSLQVYPAASLPQTAIDQGCPLIINNLAATPFDRFAQLLLPMDAAECLSLIADIVIGS